MKLLTIGDQSPKLAKSDRANLGYKSALVYLLPHSLSGHNVCPFASEGCKATCLNWSGRGRTNVVQQSRLNKTEFFFKDRVGFKKQLEKEIDLFVKKTERDGFKAAVRLNGLSDLPVETIFADIINNRPNVQFYDYTKSNFRYKKWLDRKLPHNYYLTFSRSENNEKHCKEFLKAGGTIAVVFRDKNYPKEFWNYPVFNMDETDLRFLDPIQHVGALYAKGKAKNDSSGFVVNVE